MFILPIVFIAIFGIAFGGSGNNLKFSLGVYKSQDQQVESIDLEKPFQEATKDSKKLQISTKKYDDLDNLIQEVKNKNIDLGVSVSFDQDKQMPLYEIILPENSLSSTLNKSVVTEILTTYSFQGNSPFKTTVADIKKSDLSGFDLLAPGLIIYGLIILIPGIAIYFTSIREKNYIFRYAVSRIKSWELILGGVLYYLLLGVIQVFILYATALAFGYKATGNVLLAIVPALLSLLFVIAIGIAISSFSDKTDSASNLGTILSIIFGFFSGSFITGIGSILEFNLLGRTFQFNDFLPTKWGTVAIEKILTNNKGLADITSEMLILGSSGLAVLILAIWLYSQKQLKART